jgi:hypothetical protein
MDLENIIENESFNISFNEVTSYQKMITNI